MKKIFTAIFVALFLNFSSAFAASSDWHENQNKAAKTKLLASFYEDSEGNKKLIAGLHFQLEDGWKIYGNDAGGIGMPPSLDFNGSTNFSKNEIIWPKAEKGEEDLGEEVINYTFYKHEVVLPVKIELQNLENASELTLKLDYGLCKDVCIPVSESFSLKISDTIDEEALATIQKFLEEKISSGEKNIAPEKKMDLTTTLLSAILLAIFGGAILNIMPCVLPVLSIKLLSIIKHSDAPISRIRFAFLSTIFGILICFLVFAILTAAIKLTGNSLGWGLQFQNPYFLISLIVILVLFLGNMLGVFEINFDQILTSILNKKITDSEGKKNIFIPNFLSGVLAVLLATPCSAPFLGSAISFALTQNFSTIFLISISIGIGFSLPYIILLVSPKLVYLLPKPGNWMLQIKQVLAGLLAATIMWLIYVLSQNLGALPAFLAGALAISILACVKIKSDLLKYVSIALIASCTFALPAGLKNHQAEKKEIYESFWLNFDEAEIYQHVAKGRVVVIDVTADWCLSCKFNKLRILQDDEVMTKLKSGNIIAMRGDITKPNEEIMKYLHKNNRFAIPFNAVYGPNAPKGLLTSELLTKKELFELIEKAK
ncbi:MAG: thioredoxin family protein [Rickettsiales bacterium]|nr:thioredoxin family protein [Rickettsiales bacterium]